MIFLVVEVGYGVIEINRDFFGVSEIDVDGKFFWFYYYEFGLLGEMFVVFLKEYIWKWSRNIGNKRREKGDEREKDVWR